MGGNIKKFLVFVWELAKIAIVAFIIVAPIRYFLFQPFIVSGASMAPNFATGDYLIIDEISYRFSGPQRGDVVVFNAGFIPKYEGQKFIKRIVGLPGETVEVKNGKVGIYRDGQELILDEKYLPKDLFTNNNSRVILGENQYFVLGDNRPESYDSRSWGILFKNDIVGKAFIRIYPFNEITTFPAVVY